MSNQHLSSDQASRQLYMRLGTGQQREAHIFKDCRSGEGLRVPKRGGAV